MEQYNNHQHEFLWALLANPADDAHPYTEYLQHLVNDFPQSGILQALFVHASDDKNLKQASVYFDTRALFKLINAPSSLIGIRDEKIIVQNSIRVNGHHQNSEHLSEVENIITHHEQDQTNPIQERYVDEPPKIEPGQEKVNYELPETVDQQLPGINNEPHLTAESQEIKTNDLEGEPVKNDTTEEAQVSIEKNDLGLEPVINETIEKAEVTLAEIKNNIVARVQQEAKVSKTQVDENRVDDNEDGIKADRSPVNEVSESVVEVQDQKESAGKNVEEEHNALDILLNQTAALDHRNEIIPDKGYDQENNKTKHTVQSADLNVAGNTAATNYFMIDKAFGERLQTGPAEDVSAPQIADITAQEIKSVGQQDKDSKDVSKYNDDTMPYTFMWWLDKTRRDHSSVYQPYINPEINDTSTNSAKLSTDELQQQYYENIFHITSVEDLDKNTPFQTTRPDIKLKEHVIIERFIQQEPQIKPQSSDRLDNENKAKKSSEDRDELVTETLASIYSDQMLYHKAIASYKKLILKFPEKSRYFVQKIELLEKKTN